ncbi:MAG: orotidine-5'-phosphate decarboxylase [Gammaproteobacteria bacterium]|nr:orotidine-5'-phosphate decarboxylase [Gammaproteobacteria bacterium]
MTETETKLIIALDFDNLSAVEQLCDQLSPSMCRLKIGKELFTRFGPAVVETVQKKGFEVFLDLKFHDIPQTVAKAVASAASLGVWMVNVHALGGARMMTAARESLSKFSKAPTLIAVTLLTSHDEEDYNQLGFKDPIALQVERLARLTHQCGLDGVVCSAQEAAAIRKLTSPTFCLVTPGIRPKGSETQDQRRILTPSEAIQQGSNFLVIGRPVTQATDPAQALAEIDREIKGLNIDS